MAVGGGKDDGLGSKAQGKAARPECAGDSARYNGRQPTPESPPVEGKGPNAAGTAATTPHGGGERHETDRKRACGYSGGESRGRYRSNHSDSRDQL